MAYKNQEKARETRKRYYWRHIDEERKRGRERKRRYRAAHRDKINAHQRARYRANAAEEFRKIYANRIRREPWRGIGAAVTAYERGDLTISELTELIDNRLKLAAQKTRKSPGAKRNGGRGDGDVNGGSR